MGDMRFVESEDGVPLRFPSACLTIPFLYSLADGMGVRIVEASLPREVCGGWSLSTLTVLLHNHLNARQRRCTLCHELIHAWYQDEPGMWEKYDEYRTRRVAALRLVNPKRLEQAMRCYGDETWRIAVECDVTVAVLQDWQAIHEGLCMRPAEPELIL